MKFKSLFALLIAASTLPASATIARLQALGMTETDNEGSYYIQDDRNVFLNAANVNDLEDTVILERGSDGTDFGGSTLQTDKDADPKAKGGAFRKLGSGVFGVYLGNESNTSALLRGVATSAQGADQRFTTGTAAMLYGADNQLDIFYGQKAGFGDWGVNLVWTEGRDPANRSKDRAHAVRLGARGDGWQGFANISTGTYVERTDQIGGNPVQAIFDGSLGFHLGGSYDVCKEDNHVGTAYGFMKKFDWDQTDTGSATSAALPNAPAAAGGLARASRGQTGKIGAGFTTWALGYGSKWKSAKGTFFTNVEYRVKEISADFAAKAEAKNSDVPVTIGYEYAATSWLTLRGSVRHMIMSTRENKNYSSLNYFGAVAANQEFGADTGGKKVTNTNTTDVRAGASFNLGKLRVDGLIGVAGNNGTAGNPGATAERGTFSMDRLMARVGMVYDF